MLECKYSKVLEKPCTWPSSGESAPLKPYHQISNLRRRTINFSNNVLLAYRAEILKGISWSNFIAAILCLVYCGLNIALIYFNYMNSWMKSVGEEPPVNKYVFHLSEFWGTFGFSLVEVFAIMQTPKHIVATVNNPRILKILLFINVVATFIPAFMVTVNLDRFEILSHELEYCSEISMSFLELILLWSLIRRNRVPVGTILMTTDCDSNSDQDIQIYGNDSRIAINFSFISLGVSMLQLGIYNGMGQTRTGGMRGEVPAHHCEFLFEIISSIITCWFTLDNMLIADDELTAILFGDHEDCKVCATHVAISDRV